MSENTGRILVGNTLSVGELPPEHRLRSVIHSALRARGVSGAGPRPETDRPFWQASQFGLERTAIFKAASAAEQDAILKGCSRALLEEAYFIEKSGMSFTAKMTLLSESTQEKMLYSLFGGEETTHFHMIASFLVGSPVAERNPFLELLSEMIQKGDRASLVFLIQVVLEGWGITHYHGLAQSCQDPELRQTLRAILKDEARHHGSGTILFCQAKLEDKQKDFIVEVLVRFLGMVQAGPQSVVSQVQRVKGHLSRNKKVELFSSLDCQAESAKRLALLKELMIQNHAGDIAERLDSFGLFKAWNAQECAKIA